MLEKHQSEKIEVSHLNSLDAKIFMSPTLCRKVFCNVLHLHAYSAKTSEITLYFMSVFLQKKLKGVRNEEGKFNLVFRLIGSGVNTPRLRPSALK